MISETAVADSYGIAFEFVSDTPDRPNDLARFYQHPTYTDMRPGHYSDDTQRSIANAKVILYQKGSIYSPLTYAEEYMKTFSEDSRAGYSRRYEEFLRNAVANNWSPEEFCLRVTRKGSNGAVMGAAVLGFLPDISMVKLAASAQALSTHSYQTIPYAQIVALSAFYTINNIGPLSDINSWLYDELHESGKSVKEFLQGIDDECPGPTTMGASSPVRLMLWALPRYKTLSDLVRKAVDVGGDTDSAAAVMVAVASESREYTNDLPKVLWDGLENGRNGLDYLRDLDKQLREW